ncbi:MAG: uroporphyrinogen-III synthase [archaeon]|nr:uroporphyrinogen-III synthase [archaeon]
MTTVGFTRPSDRLDAGMKICERMDLSCLCAPSLEPQHGSPETFALVKRILSEGSAYFTVFASITAIEECVKEFGKDMLSAYLDETYVACTGASTAKALKEMVGRDCDLVPEVYSGECVAEEIKDEVGDKLVLLLRSDSGDDRIRTILQDAGAYVEDMAVYGMVPAPFGPMHERLLDGIASGEVNAMVFSSPMTARTFYSQMQERFGKDKADELLSELFKVAIGKPTREAMEAMGIGVDATPEKSTFEGMLQVVADRFSDSDN